MRHPQASRLFLLAAVCAVTGSCKSSSAPSRPSITAYILGVRGLTGTTKATLVTGSVPSSGSGAAVTTQAQGGTIVGGTSIYKVSSGSQTILHVFIAVSGTDDYYDLVLPAATSQSSVLLTFAQAPPVTSFDVQFAGGTTGAIGPFTTAPVRLTKVGTGDVQVSVAWDALSDVDLHVVDPSGSEIFYANRTSPSHGVLDLDSNAGCAIDGVNNENVTWPTGQSPAGSYTVRVDYFLGCSAPVTNYAVTITVSGRDPQIFTGSFTGPGDGGSRGSGRLISSFTK